MNKIGVIVPFHREQNHPYLSLCLESIKRQNAEKEIKIAIVHSCKLPSDQDFEDCVFINVMDGSAETYSKKENIGAKHLLQDPDIGFIVTAQDDLIFGLNSLHTMKLMVELSPTPMLLNSLSNCDAGASYIGALVIPTPDGSAWQIPQFTKLEDVKGHELEIMNMGGGPFVAFPQNYLCTYATMMSRSTWNMIGGFDEEYQNGVEDVDFCIRARKLGIECYISTASFIFHFGGATSNHVIDKKGRAQYNYDLFKQKHGFDLQKKLAGKKQLVGWAPLDEWARDDL